MSKKPPQKLPPESSLRDALAKNLDIIRGGLSLIDKEKFLPNDKGAAGFLDIFARSTDGRLVIIELKKSNASAREAIQELSKYAALLKASRLIKETEYELLVVSVEWHELLVPFSEFVHATRYECTGKKLLLDASGTPTNVEDIEPLPPVETRKISRRHFIWEFKDKDPAERSIPIIEAYLRGAGLNDFVLLIIELAEPAHNISCLVYFAQQEKTLDEYMQLIRRRHSKESVAEFEDWLSELSEEEDRISEAADKVWESADENDSLFAKLDSHGAQIAHPEKAQYWLQPKKAAIITCHRFGRFNDADLADETIIEEIKGTAGGSNRFVNISANVHSKPEFDALIVASDNLFFFNPEWKTNVRDLCNYAKARNYDSINLRAFSNDDIFAALSSLAIGDPNHTPSFEIDLVKQDNVETFAGTIQWNGNSAKYDEIISSFFERNGFSYFMERHFGAQRNINADLMQALGLQYTVWRVGDDGNHERIRIQGNTIVNVRGETPKLLDTFCEENTDLLRGVVGLFLSHDYSFIKRFQRLKAEGFNLAEAELEKLIEPNASKNPSYWLSALTNCDVCERPFETARFMVDGTLKQGPAACLCAVCFHHHGVGIGWGTGQLYENTEKGWLLVAGGPDSYSEN